MPLYECMNVLTKTHVTRDTNSFCGGWLTVTTAKTEIMQKYIILIFLGSLQSWKKSNWKERLLFFFFFIYILYVPVLKL